MAEPTQIHIPLAEKVAFLKQPSHYPHAPGAVEVVETHMSWLFLAGRLVYKLKKPAKRAFLDFSTLEKRHANGREEVRLNRRLAGDVYRGLVPLVVDKQGRLRLEGEGVPVEWLVKMRRLPADRMLDFVIEQGELQGDEVQRAARLLATFYRKAPPEHLPPAEYLRRRKNDIWKNAEALTNPRYALPPALVEEVMGWQKAFLEENGVLLKKRAAEKRILEAHGDLRPEHICLLPEPIIFDCLEFNRDFRILDPADELSFLAMECDYLGAHSVGPLVLATYTSITGDRPPHELLAFHKSHRAGLRAKLSVWHITSDMADAEEKWHKKAVRYLKLARSYLPDH